MRLPRCSWGPTIPTGRLLFASRRIAAAPIQAAAVQRRCATQAADPWPGLESWRGSGIDGRRVWGLKLAEQVSILSLACSLETWGNAEKHISAGAC